jgi:hypothetical protein
MQERLPHGVAPVALDGTMQAASLFLPGRALQGATIPGYIRWQGNRTVQRITIQSSFPFHVEEVHNGAVQSSSRNACSIAQVEAIPYIGFVLKCDTFDAPALANFSFEWEFSDGKKDHETRAISLYRPVLVLEKSPEKIKVEVKSSGVEVNDRIIVQNTGEGTAVVSFHRGEKGSIEIKQSPMMKEFQNGFLQDVATKVPTLAKDHPKHADLVEKFPALIFSVTDVRDTGKLVALDAYLAELSEELVNDEAFGSDLSDVVVWAFTRNLQTTMMMEQFVEFMRSLGSSKVIIVNALDTVHLKAGQNVVELCLAQTDLERNPIEPLQLPSVIVEAKEELDLPVHKLFRFSEA